MNEVKLDVILRLRRDNDYNYAKIKDTFIPQKGEVCLVDTAKDGLRAVCGDGVTTFANLEYMDSLFVRAYYNDGSFYKDSNFTEPILGSETKLYIDKLTNKFYYFDEETSRFLTPPGNGTIGAASENVAGIMKLYSKTGSNEDGTMTQKAITEELSEKIEIELNQDLEMLIFI